MKCYIIKILKLILNIDDWGILQLILDIDGWGISYEIGLRLMWNGFFPSDNKPLPALMLTQTYVEIWCNLARMSYIKSQYGM